MIKSNLNKFAKKSKLMDMAIVYGDEKFTFNLFQELNIDENTINRELQSQSQSLAFLAVLHKKLIRLSKDTSISLNKTKADVWLQSKNTNLNGRVPTKEDLKAMVDKSPKVIKLSKQLSKLEHNCELLDTCVRTFETRSHMLQTISANTRRK